MTHPQSSIPPPIQLQNILSIIGNIQRLTVKAFGAKNLQNLIFIILNDTYQIIKYDRCILFRKKSGKVTLLGISGQATFNFETELASRLKEGIKNLENSSRQRIFTADDFSSCPGLWDFMHAERHSTVYWAPFIIGNEEIGLWLERYDDPEAAKDFEACAPLIRECLLPGYAAAWEKMSSHFSLNKILPRITLKRASLIFLGLLILLFLIPIYPRVIAPCEIVAKAPYIVRAPLEGVIDHVAVLSGEEVSQDGLLFEYNNRVPNYQYQIALKNVDLLQAELSRTYILGTGESSEMSKLAKASLELKNGELNLAFAKRQLNLLAVKSPSKGIANIDDPDNWRGKPVRKGEKIMTISNPKESKIKIWIPEKEMIKFAQDVPIDVFFNPIPRKTFKAKLLFVIPEVKASENILPSLEAEAEWLDVEDLPKLGLKGYAIIYGERTTLFYLLMHTLRKYILRAA